MQAPTFFEKVPSLVLRDPLAQFLGAAQAWMPCGWPDIHALRSPEPTS